MQALYLRVSEPYKRAHSRRPNGAAGQAGKAEAALLVPA